MTISESWADNSKSCVVIGSRCPFIAFIRSTGERLQISYASFHHVIVPIAMTHRESCLIYAAGFEITIKGTGMELLADILLDAKARRIRQGGEPMTEQGNKTLAIESIAWEPLMKLAKE